MNSSIWLRDRIITSIATSRQREPRSNSNKNIPHSLNLSTGFTTSCKATGLKPSHSPKIQHWSLHIPQRFRSEASTVSKNPGLRPPHSPKIQNWSPHIPQRSRTETSKFPKTPGLKPPHSPKIQNWSLHIPQRSRTEASTFPSAPGLELHYQMSYAEHSLRWDLIHR